MKTSYQYEMEVFVSKKLGFGFLLETVKVSEGGYQVKLVRFDPENDLKDRITWLMSTLGGLTFNECCDKIESFKLKYDC